MKTLCLLSFQCFFLYWFPHFIHVLVIKFSACLQEPLWCWREMQWLVSLWNWWYTILVFQSIQLVFFAEAKPGDFYLFEKQLKMIRFQSLNVWLEESSMRLWCSVGSSFWGFERTEQSDGSDWVAYCSDIDSFAFCFLFFEASSGQREANVATKSLIIPISMVSRFFLFSFIFSSHDIVTSSEFFPQMPISPSLGWVSVQFFRRPRRKTRTKSCPKNLAENFWPSWFFLQKHFVFGYLPTPFINFDAFFVVAYCSNEFLPSLSCHPWLKISRPRFFGRRKVLVAEKGAKK